jgi:predicted small secreted protein
MKLISKALILVLIFGALTTINGCNTVHGFGQDVSATGHGIQNAS